MESQWEQIFQVLLLIYSRTFLKKNYEDFSFFRYIDDLSVFNSNNFEEISSKIYPDDLILKRTHAENISRLDLKLKKNYNKWHIGLYNRRKGFDFKVNGLTNWYQGWIKPR